jgi:hypothetical protein
MLSVANPLSTIVLNSPKPVAPTPIALEKVKPENRYSEANLLKKLSQIPPPSKKNGKHLILDLDETLVHTFGPYDDLHTMKDDMDDDQKKRIYSLKFSTGDTMQGYVRPHVEEFLRVAFAEFESVGVWSAGTKEYVNLIVDLVFRERRPAFVLSRDQCNELRVRDEAMPCRYKPLDVIYHKYPDHNETNTVIVDDRHDICALNCMNNIRVPEFNMDSTNYEAMLKDPTLLILAEWIQTPTFRQATDVRRIKSQSPFKI